MASIELLTVAEVSKLLKCNVDYVYKLKKSGLSTYDGKDVTDPFNVKEL